MNIFSRITSRFGAKPEPKKRVEPTVRGFKAAKPSRLQAGWSTIPTPINSDLRTSLKALVAHSRDLAQNTDYVRGFIRLIQNNTIGADGIALQARVTDPNGKADTLANIAVETAWSQWCKRGVCDLTGRNSFRKILRACAGSLVRDGEYLVRKRTGPYNDFGFALEVLDPMVLDTDLIREIKPNHWIFMGIEFYDKRPIAYHLLTKVGIDGTTVYGIGSKKYERVPSDEIIHGFFTDFTDQARGFPWASAGANRLKMLDGYNEAELVAARVASAKVGFFTENAEGEGYVGEPEDGSDPDGPLVMDAEPGTFTQLPKGVDFKSFDPQHPTAAFKDFVKANLQGIATGLGVTYFALTGDLEAVNYSSGRLGRAEDQELYKEIQNDIIETLCEDVFATWIRFALQLGKIVIAGKSVTPTAQRAEKFGQATWQPRRWAMIDPTKEADASERFISLRIKSRSQIIRENGGDPDEIFNEIAEENKKLDALGIRPTVASPGQQQAAPQQGEANA